MIVASGDDNEDSQLSNEQSLAIVREEKQETSGWTEHVWTDLHFP